MQSVLPAAKVAAAAPWARLDALVHQDDPGCDWVRLSKPYSYAVNANTLMCRHWARSAGVRWRYGRYAVTLSRSCALQGTVAVGRGQRTAGHVVSSAEGCAAVKRR